MAGLLGKKIGMTQVFGPDGKVVPVTVIEAGPCPVLEVYPERGALRLGFGRVKEQKLRKPQRGYFAKQAVDALRHIRDLPFAEASGYEKGQQLDVSLFHPGDYVDVSGITKGRGFSGMIKRWGASRFPMTHGHPHHRVPGSQGSSATPSRVFKGKKLPGHYGHEQMTVQNLRVIEVRPEENLLLVKGAIPGPCGELVVIRAALKKKTNNVEEKD